MPLPALVRTTGPGRSLAPFALPTAFPGRASLLQRFAFPPEAAPAYLIARRRVNIPEAVILLLSGVKQTDDQVSH